MIRMLSSMMAPDIGRGISSHQAACAPLFQLLKVGLKAALSAADSVEAVRDVPREVLQLRDAVYRTALNWFANDPMWFFGDEAGVSRDLDALRQFRHFLDEDAKVKLPWGDDSGGRLIGIQNVLYILCDIEIQRLSVWLDPLNVRREDHKSIAMTERQLASAFHIHPKLATATAKRFAHDAALQDVLGSAIARGATRAEVQDVPDTVSFFVRKTDAKDLGKLRTWSRTSIAEALGLLLSEHGSNPHVASYVSRTLLSYDPTDLGFFLPQLVQKLQNDPTGSIENFLKVASLKDEKFAHLFVWMLRGEGRPGDH